MRKIKKIRHNWRLVIIASFVVLVVGLAIYFANQRKPAPTNQTKQSNPSKSSSTLPSPTPTQKPTAPITELTMPIAEFQQRITKKPFGIYITPQTSPVQPERFSGYHTGVDVEYGDKPEDVPVYAINDGMVSYSSFVAGYGGVVCLDTIIDGVKRTVLYGHIAPASLPALGVSVKKGQQIGRLGKAYSAETDGERKHLHFAVLSSAGINLRGYVSSRNQLSAWLDPVSLSFQ